MTERWAIFAPERSYIHKLLLCAKCPRTENFRVDHKDHVRFIVEPLTSMRGRSRARAEAKKLHARFLVGHVQKLVELMIKFLRGHFILFCCSWFRLQSIAIHCNRRECRQDHLTRNFSPAQCACIMMCHTTLAQVSARAHHVISMAIHDERLSVCSLLLCSSPCSFPCVSPTPCSSLPTSTGTLS